jgi:hypothetical protein
MFAHSAALSSQNSPSSGLLHGDGSLESALHARLAALDVEALVRRYQDEDGLLILPDVIPPEHIAVMQREARSLMPLSRRTFAPFIRKAEAICHFDITARAPSLHALQQSPSLHALCARVAGLELGFRSAGDPHASGLYVYNRPRDHVGWHYDDCGCEPETSFTIIAGIIDDSSSRLEVELHRNDKAHERARPPGSAPRPAIRRSIATRPGTLVFFRGSSVYHRVTPLAAGEERVSFSFVYVKKGFHPRGFDRIWQSTIDTLLYFGWRGVPRRR